MTFWYSNQSSSFSTLAFRAWGISPVLQIQGWAVGVAYNCTVTPTTSPKHSWNTDVFLSIIAEHRLGRLANMMHVFQFSCILASQFLQNKLRSSSHWNVAVMVYLGVSTKTGVFSINVEAPVSTSICLLAPLICQKLFGSHIVQSLKIL